MQLSLRNFFVSAALLGPALLCQSALAEAPMVKTQAPGYQRMMLGAFEVTALSDGTVKLPMGKLLVDPDPGKIRRGLERNFLQENVETSVNAYLVNTGSKLVLIDTGAAGLFGPTLATCCPACAPPATSPSRSTRSTSPTCTPTTSAA